MKNYVVLFIFIILLNASSFSQDKGYIAISAGPAIPLSDFSAKDIGLDFSGFAKMGPSLDISIHYKTAPHFGIALLFREQTNAVDEVALTKETAREYIFSQPKVQSGQWSIGGLLGGVYGTWPISKKVRFEIKQMIGYLKASSPETFIVLNNSNHPDWTLTNSSSTQAFTTVEGIGLNFQLNKHLCVLAGVDQLLALATFKTTMFNSTQAAPLQSEQFQDFWTLHFTLGLGIRL